MSLLDQFFGAAGGAATSALNPIAAVASLGESIIGRIWPDENDPARQEALYKLRELEQTGELKTIATMAGLDAGQIEINKIEAASNSLFVAGWRPALGWICDIAVAVYYIPRFVVGTIFWSISAWNASMAGAALPPLPEMGIADIIALVATLLGSSTIRYLEKKHGVAR